MNVCKYCKYALSILITHICVITTEDGYIFRLNINSIRYIYKNNSNININNYRS